MNKICYDHVSGTFSQVIMAGILVSHMISIPPVKDIPVQGKKPLLQDPYSWNGTNASFNPYRSSITGQLSFAQNTFEEDVGNFYAYLLANQEPLGAEFEKVLYDNIWNLYES